MSDAALRRPRAEVAGAPEAALTSVVRGRLPAVHAAPPPPPWWCRVEALVWAHRCPPSAREALAALLPAALRSRGGPRLVVAAAVRYADSPVGPYEELVAGVVAGPLRVHLPFLAVDSAASLAGGRVHWALPKTLAVFERLPDRQLSVRGDGWAASVRPQARAPRLPLAGLVRVRQQAPDGAPVRGTATLLGAARPAAALVDVATDRGQEPGSLAAWLLPGRHPAALLRGRLRVGR